VTVKSPPAYEDTVEAADVETGILTLMVVEIEAYPVEVNNLTTYAPADRVASKV